MLHSDFGIMVHLLMGGFYLPKSFQLVMFTALQPLISALLNYMHDTQNINEDFKDFKAYFV